MKTIQILLPDNLHEQLQAKASETGFDLSAYILALLSEGSIPRIDFPSVTQPGAAAPVKAMLGVENDPVPPSAPPSPPAPLPPPPPVKNHLPGCTKGPRFNMSVTIHWKLIGKGDPLPVRKSTATETLVQTLWHLSRVLGPETLEKLTAFKVSRGPLVSRNPGRDYVNKNTMGQYGHHLIPGTDLYVLTHSSTDEKIEILEAVPQFLKLPLELFEITKHRKS